MRGFLFDTQCSGDKVILWLKTERGMVRVTDDYRTFFYARHPDMEELKRRLEKRGLAPVLEEMPTIYNENLSVFRVEAGVSDFTRIVRELEKEYEYDLEMYNADIPLNQRYLYDKGLMPLQQVEFEYEGNGSVSGGGYVGRGSSDGAGGSGNGAISKLLWIENIDRNEHDYEVPDLKTLSLEFKLSDHRYADSTKIWGVYFNGELMKGWERKLLCEFMRKYVEYDADVIIFDNEEEFLIPFLQERFLKYGMHFSFGREAQVFKLKKGKSYFSYGHIVRRNAPYYFFGRWHLNANWFMFSEGNLNGLVEFSRTTGVLPQKAARTSPGSGVSNLQVLEAYKNGYLVPYKKNQVEVFKDGNALYNADRGGMILEPKVGMHTEVAEIDFFSLYPSIMVVHNLSPETMFCKCCEENTVPQLGFNVCEKKDGILRNILAPILKRRLYYKKMKKTAIGDELQKYEERSVVLKWLLVTCFGYTGYKNAKFGRIETHQSICAFARHKLLQAMRIAEKHGFQVLHGIIDSLWIRKEGYRKEEVESVCREIEEVTEVPIKIENFYKWFVFLPSLVNPKVPVPTRFYGVNLEGELKVRGIELRRKDTCNLVKLFQEECLNLLGEAETTVQFHERIPQLFFVLDKYLKKLKDGDFVLKDLVIKRQLSKPLYRYKGNNVQREIATQLQKHNITVAPGMSTKFVFVENGKQKQYQKAVPVQFLQSDAKYSVKEYEKLLVKALEAIILPFGYSEEEIWRKLESEKQMALNYYQETAL
ncbi:MAG: DNA polymerase domain-containing protein [Candidatus Micrarchaeota archaeon]